MTPPRTNRVKRDRSKNILAHLSTSYWVVEVTTDIWELAEKVTQLVFLHKTSKRTLDFFLIILLIRYHVDCLWAYPSNYSISKKNFYGLLLRQAHPSHALFEK